MEGGKQEGREKKGKRWQEEKAGEGGREVEERRRKNVVFFFSWSGYID